MNLKGLTNIEIGGNVKTLIIVVAVLLFIYAIIRLVIH
jgi:hypothetical protein